ncbi:MAG: hypothetical protein ACRCXT_12020 [Paraclostridium sp.]
MKTLNAIKRTTSFMIIFSIIYSIFESNIGFLAPILTVVIPFNFMKTKDSSQSGYNENKKTLSRLLLFNFISIELVAIATQNTSNFTFNLSMSMLIYLIYFTILSNSEKKMFQLRENPEALYDEMKKKVDALEEIYAKAIEDMENTSDEKAKHMIQNRINKLSIKINSSKKQLDMIKSLINNKE